MLIWVSSGGIFAPLCELTKVVLIAVDVIKHGNIVRHIRRGEEGFYRCIEGGRVPSIETIL